MTDASLGEGSGARTKDGAPSRIEAIIARAREKAAEEERQRQSRRSQSLALDDGDGVGDDDDDDDDENDLSDVDFASLAQTAKRKRGARKSVSAEKEEEEEDEDEDEDEEEQIETIAQPAAVAARARTKRAAAQRTEAYRFRPSLERPSNGKRLLAEAKLSAAVQSGLATTAAQTSQSRRRNKYNDEGIQSIRSIVAEEQRRRKEGADVDGMSDLLDMMRRSKAIWEANFLADSGTKAQGSDAGSNDGDGDGDHGEEDTDYTSDASEAASCDSARDSDDEGDTPQPRTRARSSEEQVLERALAVAASPSDDSGGRRSKSRGHDDASGGGMEDDGDAEAAHKALAIVRRDRQVSQDGSAHAGHDRWRRFWTGSIAWPDVDVDESSSSSSSSRSSTGRLLLKLCAASNDERRFRALVDSRVLATTTSALGPRSAETLGRWLMQTALFTPTGTTATVALRGLAHLLAAPCAVDHLAVSAALVGEALPAALTRLGARPDVVADCFSLDADSSLLLPPAATRDVQHDRQDKGYVTRGSSRKTSNSKGSTGKESNNNSEDDNNNKGAYMRSGERLRIAERLVAIAETVGGHLVAHHMAHAQAQALAIDLGLAVAFAGAHPGHEPLWPRVEALLETLWPAALDARASSDADELLADRVRTLLTDAPAPCQAVLLARLLPRAASLRAATVRRWVAWRILTDNAGEPTSTDGYGPVLSLAHLHLLVRILGTRDRAINALSVAGPRQNGAGSDANADADYEGVAASVELLGIALGDVALQISRVVARGDLHEEQGGAAYRAAVERFWTGRHGGQIIAEMELSSSLSPSPSSSSSSSSSSTHTLRRVAAKVTAVRDVAEALRQLQARIHDGRGAFLVRARAKDAILRLAHELEYAVRTYTGGSYAGKLQVRTLDQMGFGGPEQSRASKRPRPETT
ncbi:hypothetical protein FA10DRAFT_281961 [Acaromyces ingoldii]|uniref:Uncharacterized protein n=1 Tax=Acaromyces ingoldii TaxID=215250 RepID=A0A316YEC1_9BASI|nr:hypothetical protein FA10DRAFT_281961 [Acaromyces ingoldii]PWN87214.1 hypothetical protein FA10DRAFT_281961 [Acaromyces ingoldii]